MAIRCSILGHAWADPEVERKREERGSEVVLTEREFRTCKRCGDHDVLGETTEVTAASATETAAAETETTATETGADGTSVTETDATGTGTDTETTATDPETGSDDVVAADDDAEILDGSAEGDRRGAGRTGEAAGRADGSAGRSNESDGQRDGTPDEAEGYPDDDGVILDDDDPESWESGWPDPGRPSDDDDYEPDPWPDAEPPESSSGPHETDISPGGPIAGRREAAGEPVNPAEVLEDAASDQDGPDAGGDDPDDDDGAVVEDGELPLEDVEVFCPNCRFVDESPMPSLRGGDSCPECQTTYLHERDTRE